MPADGIVEVLAGLAASREVAGAEGQAETKMEKVWRASRY